MNRPPLPHVVFLDACVLYPAPIRDLFMRLALKGLIRLRWNQKVHEEWIENLVKRRPELSLERLRRIPSRMADALESQEPLVTGYEDLLAHIDIPDENDRHVVAAAIVGRAEAILTFNTRDFPQEILERWDLIAYHPDEYLVEIMDLLIRERGIPKELLDVLREQRAHLRKPPLSQEDFLASLERSGLRRFAQAVKEFRHML